jgi:hypothetical protein
MTTQRKGSGPTLHKKKLPLNYKGKPFNTLWETNCSLFRESYKSVGTVVNNFPAVAP